jgi:hypothetical protein
MLRSPAQPCGRIDGATNVQDLAPLFQMVIVIAAVVSPVLLFTRFLRGESPVSFAHMFYVPDLPSWPRGIQEEEPVHFVFGGSAA